MSLGVFGELEKGTVRFHEVTWRIPNIMSLRETVDGYYSSPHFNFLNSQWFIKIDLQVEIDETEYLGLCLGRSSQGPPQIVDCIFSIRNHNGREEKFFHMRKCIFCLYNSLCGPSRLFKMSELPLRESELPLRESELAPSDALTIVCKLSSNMEDQTLISRDTQTEDLAEGVAKEESCAHLDTKGGAILLTHFQNLLLDSKDHDVTLKVKDRKFRAHKTILRVRSPVFSAMFAHDMVENECGEVCIEDCEPNAFREFLKYVYVGKFENMPPATAVNLYYIAEKYDFPDLKKTCVEFLKASLTTNAICDVVPLAMNHGEDALLECAMEFFSKHMIETFMTVEWQQFNARSPHFANELSIKAMQISHKSAE